MLGISSATGRFHPTLSDFITAGNFIARQLSAARTEVSFSGVQFNFEFCIFLLPEINFEY